MNASTRNEKDTKMTEPTNVWNAQPPVEPKKLHPKKKHKWGMPEVLISFMILLVTQVAVALGFVFYATAQQVAAGNTDVALATEAVTAMLYSPVVLITTSALMYFSWWIMMWYSTRFRGLKSWAKDFWVKFEWRDLGIGAGIAVFGFILVQGLSTLLEALGVNMNEASNTEIFQQQEGFWKYFFFIAMVSLIGPFMEELFFRGFLMQALIRHFRRGNISSPRGGLSNWFLMNSANVFNAYVSFRNWGYKHKYAISAVLSSIVFGFMHFQGTSLGQWMTVLITGMLGFVFAWVTIKTKRLGPAIIGHILYNGTVATLTLTMF